MKTVFSSEKRRLSLQKKNQAQLMWTKKQLQETIARNKQWNEETSQKEAEIQEIRGKIEEH